MITLSAIVMTVWICNATICVPVNSEEEPIYIYRTENLITYVVKP